MSFLLDTDICSAYLKNDSRVVAKVMLHFGGLRISVITVGELLTWARRAAAPDTRVAGVGDLVAACDVVEVTLPVAERFGELSAALFDQGQPTDEMDLFIAASALVHNLALVTHNVRDFENIPGLIVEDWLAP